MDPLTHTLVGANLASTRLGEKSRFAATALIIGANLPDVDAILYFTGHSDLALGFRRGWTHGILALVVLPVLLTAVLWGVAAAAPGRRTAPGAGAATRANVNVRWLLLLSFLAILTHPVLDWLNNYGMRWLMPFRGTWSYGDSVYIMDPWLWLILGSGWLAGRRPTAALITIFAVITLALAWVVSGRSPSYLVMVGIVALALFLALLWKPTRSYSTPALILAAAYIGARLVLHYATAQEVQHHLRADRLMVSPHPLDPTRWDVVAQIGDEYRYGKYTWLGRKLTVEDHRIPVAKDSPEWNEARRDPSIRGFMTWVRFPWYEVEKEAGATRVLIHDARYATRRRPGGGFGGVVVVIPARTSSAARE